MKTDDHQPPARGQAGHRLRQRAPHLAEFVVHGDADGLESAGGRVFARGRFGFAGAGPARLARARRGGGDQPRQLHGVGNRAVRQSAFNRAGDGAGKTLLAERAQRRRQLALIDPRQPLGRGRAGGGVHAHVQRPGGGETETARGRVQLRRRHAEVKQHAGHPAAQAARFEDFAQARERRVDDFDSRAAVPVAAVAVPAIAAAVPAIAQGQPRAGHGLGVAVNR